MGLAEQGSTNTEANKEKLTQAELKRVWAQVIAQANEDLADCPEHIHAECQAMSAADFFRSDLAEKAFTVCWPDEADERLKEIRSKIVPCKHKISYDRLRILMRK